MNKIKNGTFNTTTNNKIARGLILYGSFLILAGLAGYLSNPEKAKTALLSGGMFGTLSILWGILEMRGFSWSKAVALATTGFLALTFTWRSTVGWLAVIDGKSEKLFAAGLISLMLMASVAMLAILLKERFSRQGNTAS